MYRYVVSNISQVTSSVVVLDLKPAADERPIAFEPGQYAALSFRRHGRPTAARCFSIASSPTSQGAIQFGIRLAGHFTHALAEAQPGDPIWVRGPFGRFTLRTDAHDRIVLCAGGIGITPLLSMARFASAISAKTDITLIYSIRNQGDVPFLADLRNLAAANPRLKLIFVCGEGSGDQLAPYPVFSGRISLDVLRLADPEVRATYFLCGPPPFMKAVTAMLAARGVDRSAILSEAFSQGPISQTSRRWSWPAHMYALGAAGTAAATLSVLASDILKTLPNTMMPEQLTSATSTAVAGDNQRQRDLDALVNTLPAQPLANRLSPGLAATQSTHSTSLTPSPTTTTVAAANTPKPVAPAANATAGTTVATKPTANATPTAVTPAPTAKPTPVPTPKPTCTTTPSGVTQC